MCRWLSVVLVLVATAGAACTGDERPHTTQATLPEQLQPGAPIRLDAAKIVSIEHGRLVVEDRSRRRIEVVPRDPAMLVGLAVGRLVDVDGTVRADGETLEIHAVRIATTGAAHPRV